MNRLALGISCLALVGACSSSTNTGVPVSDAAASSDAPGSGDAGSDGPTGGVCTAAIEQTLKPIDRVSTRTMSVLSDTAGTKTLFIDATAGGINLAAQNPYIYVNLERAQRVDLTDKTARASTDWDLALKRQVIFSNSGDGGSGQGGTAAPIAKAFDQVTLADAPTFEKESFFDQDCNAKLDQINAVMTTWSDWYAYDTGTNQLSPKALTYVVRGGTGKKYKVAIQTYYGAADGGTGLAGALFIMKVAAL